MRVGLTYNLRQDHPDLGTGPADVIADWDLPEPMAELAEGLRSLGHDVVDIGSPAQVIDIDYGVELIFNVAEMVGLRYREALAPALFEFLDLPYTFSPPDAMVLTLDKNVANLLVRQAGGAVADWAVVSCDDDPALERLVNRHPEVRWIVKPVAEGSSMGITPEAVCDTADEIGRRVRAIVVTYGQPALVQRFLAGRELTVGVVEVDGRPFPLAPMEIDLTSTGKVPLFHFASKEGLGEDLVPCIPVEPGDVLYEPARQLAALAFETIPCRDAARVDLRCTGGSRDLCFLEINALPGLDPLSAQTFAMDYRQLLATIVTSAARRWGLDGTKRGRYGPARRRAQTTEVSPPCGHDVSASRIQRYQPTLCTSGDHDGPDP